MNKNLQVDVSSETSIKFRDVEKHSLSVASALARRGFKKGDVLFFVTYELAQLSVVHLAVWRLGGSVRGCYQAMPPGKLLLFGFNAAWFQKNAI
jgi:acyl-coenzyme A synthetase/AMP-(fatty) acid ligase